MTLSYPGKVINWLVVFPFAWIFRAWIRRCPKTRRNLLIGTACVVYVFFLVNQVGQLKPSDGSSEKSHYRSLRNRHSSVSGIPLERSQTIDMAHPEGLSRDSVTTLNPNVVYITLRSKRSKPANIRGTIKPKIRKKFQTLTSGKNYSSRHQQLDKFQVISLPAGNVKKQKNSASFPRWNLRTRDEAVTIRSVKAREHKQLETAESNIRIYSDQAPPWFSKHDVKVMHLLADCRISRIQQTETPIEGDMIIFEGNKNHSMNLLAQSGMATTSTCQGQLGLVKKSFDVSEVFAFHLDRILGLNRTLPAVSRKFSFTQGGHPCPIIVWDASLSQTDNETHSTIMLKWGRYQRFLKQKCWLHGKVPKAEWGCSDIHHYEWSKMSLFDFLLQAHDRLDKNCCGFKPRREDSCVQSGLNLKCNSPDNISLTQIVQRKENQRHLIFVDNKGFFDRSEENLNFKVLQGIEEFPEEAVAVLRSQRLREKLLQSLFMDKVYWESQGGRQGIEKLIDVVERRAKILLTFINAHGAKVLRMNE
ncbi:Golgi-associated kinase 1B [Protopterus annectens]|uniref:Golgi-associated kinase 1B n=1 Tax=Protopterus annectens TaxID=7888 RepID=UPI001CFBED2B|nr:Golgi-associated kinase 1B [Protopterus annectens]